MRPSSPHVPPRSATASGLLLAFMLTTVLVPATILNKILFVMLMVWTVRLLLLRGELRPRLSMPALCGVAIFTYGLLLCLPARNDNALAIQFFLSIFVLMLIHFVEYFRIDIDRAAETCGKVMIVVTVMYWILVVNSDLPFADALVRWFNDASQSASAERDFVEDAPTLTIALGAVPFLFVPWCLVSVRLLQQRRPADFVWLLLYGAAIALSGARGIVVVALAFLAIATIWLASPRVRVVLVVALALALAIGVPALLATTTLFSTEEASNADKIGHFTSFLDSLDVPGALFGHGLGSFYYSSGKGVVTPHTELTPIDLARYIGIPLAIVFYGLLLLPCNRLSHYRGTNLLFSLGFLLFLVLSLTNPTLINSYGMLAVVWYWSKVQRPPQLRPAEQVAARTVIASQPGTAS
jgi:hypothetical protein